MPETEAAYLGQVRVRISPDVPLSRRQELMTAELHRGWEVHSAGTIQRIWPVPSALANVGV